MSTYIHFTEEQKQRAASVDLEEFLRCRGEKLLASGREKRLARDHSVTIRGNEWYDHAEERGGHAVSFVQRFYHLSYPEAVTMLLGGELGTVYPSAEERVEEPQALCPSAGQFQYAPGLCLSGQAPEYRPERCGALCKRETAV